MNKIVAKTVALLLLCIASASVPQKVNAESFLEQVKYFITHNQYYNHALTIGSGIYSFALLAALINSNNNRLDGTQVTIASFAGACVVSKIVHDNPGYSTLAGIAVLIYNYFMR